MEPENINVANSQNTGPAIQNTGPVVQNTGPVVQNTGPAIQNTGPAMQNTGQAIQTTGPVVQNTGLAMQNTGPYRTSVTIINGDNVISPSTDNDINNNSNNSTRRRHRNNRVGLHEVKCLCKRMPVKTASYIVGIVESLAIAGGIIFFFTNGGCSLVGLLGTMLWTLAVLFLFLGLKHERPRYLLLNMFMQILQTIVFLILLGVSIYWVALGEMRKDDDTIMLGCLFLVASLLGILIELWFFEIVLKCYRFFRQKMRRQLMMAGNVPNGINSNNRVFVEGFPVVGLFTLPPPQYNSSQPATIQTYSVGTLAPLPTYDEVLKTQA